MNRTCGRGGRGFGVLLALIALMPGCGGGDDFERFPISGTVTFGGAPVEYGSISFQPDETIGDVAPSVYASVEDGQYHTDEDEGPTRGRYHVHVFGFDKARMRLDVPPGTPIETPVLFPTYELEVDIPAPDNEFNVDVPADHGRRNR
jgi:hypothetical protein